MPEAKKFILKNGNIINFKDETARNNIQTLSTNKVDKVSSPTSGNFAGLDSNGNLTDSGKKAADFATPIDIAGEEIAGTATGSSITLTDSADGYVQGVTVKGHSRKTKNLLKITATTQTINDVTFTVNSDGTIKVNGTSNYNNTFFNLNYVGNDVCSVPTNKNLTVNWTGSNIRVDIFYDQDVRACVETLSDTSYTAFIPNTAYRSWARLTVINTSIPINNTVVAPMICTSADYVADPTFESYFDGIKSVGDAGWGVVDLGTLTWTYNARNQTFYARSRDLFENIPPINGGYKAVCSNYDCVQGYVQDKQCTFGNKDYSSDTYVWIKDTSFTDAIAFKSAMSGVLLYYPLGDTTGATPTFGITSKNGAGQGTAATITTGLPLRSTLDGTVYDELTTEKVITRCEVVEGEVVPLATLTETPLTSAEKSALASLRTYDHITHIDATDDPIMTVGYLLNTNNGKAVTKVDKKIGEKYTIAEKTKLAGIQDNATANEVIDTTVTLTVNGWVGNDAPYTQTVNVAVIRSTDQAIVDLSVSSTVATGLDEIDDWALISKIETGAGTITFTCYEDKPTTELTANVHIVRGTSSGAASPTLKSVTWTGTGTNTRSITFPEKPTLILSIQFTNKSSTNAGMLPCRYGNPSIFCVWGSSPQSWNGGYASALTYSVDELTMTITGTDKGSAWNDETTDYILYYI